MHFARSKQSEAIPGTLPGWRRAVYVAGGACLAAFGLEMFLTPNQIIPGGVHGLSSLLSHVTEMQMGLILFFLNLPYVIYSRFSRKRPRYLLTVLGFLLLTGITLLLHPFPPLVEDPPLAAAGGGVLLGLGVGLVLFYSGPLDGLQEAAHVIRKKLPLTVDEIVMIINIGLLGLAGFIFGWDQALYSVIAFAIAMTTTKWTVNRLYRYKAVWIHTSRPQALRRKLEDMPGVAFYTASNPNLGTEDLYLTVPRAQGEALSGIVSQVDPEATLWITPVHSLRDQD